MRNESIWEGDGKRVRNGGVLFSDDDEKLLSRGRGRIVTSLGMDFFFDNSSEISFLILNNPSH
jgi:hypothetical protein